MHRSDEERLADILMGDAVLQLLRNVGPVSNDTLLEKLRIMASQESDPERLKALRLAMAEVMNNKQTTSRNSVALKDADNVTHIFRNRSHTGKDTQH